MLQCLNVTKFQNCEVTMLQCCKVAMLQSCKVANLQCCNVAMLQSFKVAKLQSCNFEQSTARTPTTGTPHARANFAKLQSLHFETCYLRTYRCPDMWASWAVAAKNQTKKYLCLDEWRAIVSDQHLFPLSFKSFSKSHISLKFGYFYPNFCMWSRIIPYKLLIAIGGQIWLH